MEELLLERGECYLVQSGHFKKNIQTITTRNSIIDLHYMGSSEFEWGALPESTQRMLYNIDFYDIISFPQYVNEDGKELMVYAPVMFKEHIAQIIDELVKNGHNLKEYCSLCSMVVNTNGKEEYCPNDGSDFWWDIDNDFYMFFGKENADLIVFTQRNMREASLGKVEEGDFSKLSKCYLKLNPDLSEEAKNFLSSSSAILVKKE